MGFGPVTTPAPGSISAPIITYISRTPYFLAGPPPGWVGATLTLGGTNIIQINVFDSHPPISFFPSAWVATVKLTTCKF
jgi:hypothetical protein